MISRYLLTSFALSTAVLAAPPIPPRPSGHPHTPHSPPKGPHGEPPKGPPHGGHGGHGHGNKTVASYTGNPFTDIKMYPNPYYRDEIYTYAIPNLEGDLAEQAAKVAEVPTFQWLSVTLVPIR
jgi:hypothetical protein